MHIHSLGKAKGLSCQTAVIQTLVKIATLDKADVYGPATRRFVEYLLDFSFGTDANFSLYRLNPAVPTRLLHLGLLECVVRDQITIFIGSTDQSFTIDPC